MPTWDYRCDKCEIVFEKTTTIAQRDQVVCFKCGQLARKLFSPSHSIQSLELKVYPLVDDNIDGVRREFRTKRDHKEFLDRYNEKQTATGRDNWRAKIPALE